ncbi:MAG: Gldg family protein [Clostridia bacterium]|nr:Gldg family protein [Clostridia bacterium]
MAEKEKKTIKAPNGKTKLKNTVALKRSVYAVILSVIFIVAVILVNVLATALASRFPLELDLTADKIHSMTGDNVDFIKSVDKKVNIYVCLTEEEYACTGSSSYNMCYYAATGYFVDYNTKNAKYFSQTVELLRKYEKYNENITVEFLDVAQPSAVDITVDFDDYGWTTGDILVACTSIIDGEEVTRRTVIKFGELYSLEEGNSQTAQYQEYYGYGYDCYALYGLGIGYNITENNIEYAASAAIYKVISETTPKFLVPTTYCESELISKTLEGTLTTNNYEIIYADGLFTSLLTEENMAQYSGIILADCTSDISEGDRQALENFLDNKGKKGKSVFYFAGTNTQRLTNLCAFLGDWAIGFKSGIVYETAKNNIISEVPTSFYLESLNTDFTTLSDSLSGKCYATSNVVPMTQLYTNSTTGNYTRSSEVLMRTGGSGTTTIMPVDADYKNWSPTSNATYDAFPAVIATEDSVTVNDSELAASYVVAFSSADFISIDWTQYSAVANINFSLDVFNYVTGSADNPFNFVAKTITNDSFLVNVTAEKTLAMKIIFVAVIPVITIAIGVFVWIRRKRA